ncbi:unnamed protein product [Amoebophrya sp. A25]|nr:unnamed protein product [Amoebophrya sp. A25]|eukprot:GSA25T00016171001.1
MKMNSNPSVNPRPYSAHGVGTHTPHQHVVGGGQLGSSRGGHVKVPSQRERAVTAARWPNRHIHPVETIIGREAPDYEVPHTVIFAPSYNSAAAARPRTAPLGGKSRTTISARGDEPTPSGGAGASSTSNLANEAIILSGAEEATTSMASDPNAAHEQHRQVNMASGLTRPKSSVLPGRSHHRRDKDLGASRYPRGQQAYGSRKGGVRGEDGPAASSHDMRAAAATEPDTPPGGAARATYAQDHGRQPALAVEEHEPHMETRTPGGGSKWNRQFLSDYYRQDPRYVTFDEKENRNSYHDPTTTTMLDIQLNNPEVMCKMQTPRAPYRPLITSLHQDYNLSHSSWNAAIPIDPESIPKIHDVYTSSARDKLLNAKRSSSPIHAARELAREHHSSDHAEQHHAATTLSGSAAPGAKTGTVPVATAAASSSSAPATAQKLHQGKPVITDAAAAGGAGAGRAVSSRAETNLDGTFHPRDLMDVANRPKSAAPVLGGTRGNYREEFGTTLANRKRDARAQLLQQDRKENPRDLASGGFGMDPSAAAGKPASRHRPGERPPVQFHVSSARVRPKSAGNLSSRSVATYSEYPAEQDPEKPAFADWDIRELSKLSPQQQEEYKEYWRKIARIPSTNDFPYRYCLGWDALKPRRPPMFAYNPLTHTTDVFVTDKKTGLIKQERTDFETPILPASVESGQGFNRRKGIGEYSDLTHLTHPRWNRGYHKQINQNERLFYNLSGPVCSFVDVMLRQGYKP